MEVVGICYFYVYVHLNSNYGLFRRENYSHLVISKEADADLHQNLSNVSYFENYNLAYVDCSLIIILFIHLDEEFVRTECCGALQLVHRGSSHLPVQLGVICWYLCLLSVYPLAATPLFPPC